MGHVQVILNLFIWEILLTNINHVSKHDIQHIHLILGLHSTLPGYNAMNGMDALN